MTRRPVALALVLASAAFAAAGIPSARADAGPDFPGAQASSFHGFERFDFEHDGRKAIVVAPGVAAEGRPWIWRARFFGHEPQTDVALLERGFHVAYIDVAGLFGGPEAVRLWEGFHRFLTESHGFAAKPALEGMSRGGLMIYQWAAAHPDKVACLYADAPVCDIRSWPGGKGTGKGSPPDWEKCLAAYGLTEEQAATAKVSPIDRLEPIARARIPALHVVGDADDVVPVSENTAILEQRYRALGGPIRVIHKPGVGHHPHSLEDPKPIVDFIMEHASLAGIDEPGPNHGGTIVKVMSFNILQGGGDAANVGFPENDFADGRLARIIEIVRACAPDVLCLQEAPADDRLVAALGEGWHRSGTILARHPLEPRETGPFLSSARMTVGPGHAAVVGLVNAHWWPRTWGPALIQDRIREENIPADPASFEREILEATASPDGPRGYQATLDALAPFLEDGNPVILAGDFNEGSHLDWTPRAASEGMDRWVANPTPVPLRFAIAWTGSRLLEDAGLRDAYRTVFPDEVRKPGITWTPPYDEAPGRRPWSDQILDRIDRIHFRAPGLRVIDAAVVGSDEARCEFALPAPWPSDHRAVLATFVVEARP